MIEAKERRDVTTMIQNQRLLLEERKLVKDFL